MDLSKPLAALALFWLAVAVVGSLAGLLLSPLLADLPALVVLALVVVAIAGASVVGAGAARRRETPYW